MANKKKKGTKENPCFEKFSADSHNSSNSKIHQQIKSHNDMKNQNADKKTEEPTQDVKAEPKTQNIVDPKNDVAQMKDAQEKHPECAMECSASLVSAKKEIIYNGNELEHVSKTDFAKAGNLGSKQKNRPNIVKDRFIYIAPYNDQKPLDSQQCPQDDSKYTHEAIIKEPEPTKPEQNYETIVRSDSNLSYEMAQLCNLASIDSATALGSLEHLENLFKSCVGVEDPKEKIYRFLRGLVRNRGLIQSDFFLERNQSIEDIVEGSKGLKNLGATCYINCIIQQLYWNSSFRHCLMPMDSKGWKNELKRVFNNLSDSQSSSVDPKEFVDSCKAFFENPNSPQDSAELLQQMLDNLSNTEAGNLFKMNLKTQSNKIELEYIHVCNVIDGIENFSNFMSELQNQPQSIIIQLNRTIFNNDSEKAELIQEPFEFPMELQSTLDKYLLYGIVLRSGSAQAGHYQSLVKIDDEWCRFNDEDVSKIYSIKSVKDIYSKSAFLLFYTKGELPMADNPKVKQENEMKRIQKSLLLSQAMLNLVVEADDLNLMLDYFFNYFVHLRFGAKSKDFVDRLIQYIEWSPYSPLLKLNDYQVSVIDKVISKCSDEYVIDSSISIFGHLFPKSKSKSAEKLIESYASSLKDINEDRKLFSNRLRIIFAGYSRKPASLIEQIVSKVQEFENNSDVFIAPLTEAALEGAININESNFGNSVMKSAMDGSGIAFPKSRAIFNYRMEDFINFYFSSWEKSSSCANIIPKELRNRYDYIEYLNRAFSNFHFYINAEFKLTDLEGISIVDDGDILLFRTNGNNQQNQEIITDICSKAAEVICTSNRFSINREELPIGFLKSLVWQFEESNDDNDKSDAFFIPLLLCEKIKNFIQSNPSCNSENSYPTRILWNIYYTLITLCGIDRSQINEQYIEKATEAYRFFGAEMLPETVNVCMKGIISALNEGYSIDIKQPRIVDCDKFIIIQRGIGPELPWNIDLSLKEEISEKITAIFIDQGRHVSREEAAQFFSNIKAQYFHDSLQKCQFRNNFPELEIGSELKKALSLRENSIKFIKEVIRRGRCVPDQNGTESAQSDLLFAKVYQLYQFYYHIGRTIHVEDAEISETDRILFLPIGKSDAFSEFIEELLHSISEKITQVSSIKFENKSIIYELGIEPRLWNGRFIDACKFVPNLHQIRLKRGKIPALLTIRNTSIGFKYVSLYACDESDLKGMTDLSYGSANSKLVPLMNCPDELDKNVLFGGVCDCINYHRKAN